MTGKVNKSIWRNPFKNLNICFPSIGGWSTLNSHYTSRKEENYYTVVTKLFNEQGEQTKKSKVAVTKQIVINERHEELKLWIKEMVNQDNRIAKT